MPVKMLLSSGPSLIVLVLAFIIALETPVDKNLDDFVEYPFDGTLTFHPCLL